MIRILTLFIAFNSFVASAQWDEVFERHGVPVPLNQGWGWFDLANSQLSDSLFFQDYLLPQNGYTDFFVLKNDSLWGALDVRGLEEMPFVYDSIIQINNRVLTLKDGVWTYVQPGYDAEDVRHTVQFDSLYCDGRCVYLYSGGKTGMITDIGMFFPPMYASIHPLSSVNAYFPSESIGYFMVLDGQQYNVLDQSGKALLPPNVWDLRFAHSGIVEFRRGEFPEYYSMYSKETISPNGRDIVFYGGMGYKLYNESKTKGVLHRYNSPVLDDYDDYFMLLSDDSNTNDFMAVRQNGKVGLLKNGVLQGSIKYDQINVAQKPWMGNYGTETFFLFFLGDSCGLLDERGVERFAPKYANILKTENEDRFIVLDRRLSGVVDGNGKTVIPLQYHHIYYDDQSELFTVQHNRKVGLFRKDGSLLVPIEYDKHRICGHVKSDYSEYSVAGVHVLAKNDELYFANSTGLIDGIAYEHYDYTKGVLKAYKKNGITVFVLSERGLVEEVVNYPLFNATVIEKDYVPLRYGFSGWEKSYLEENQREGYFGLRLYAERGFGVPPTYRNVRVNAFQNALGEVAYTDNSIPWMNDVAMTIIRSYDEMDIGSGSVINEPLYTTETLLFYSGTSDRRVNMNVDGSQVFSGNEVRSRVDLSDGVLYGDFLEGNSFIYRRFFMGGRPEICPIAEADVSLFDYYQYWNLADACRLDHAWMSKVLDPKVGVRFVNSQRSIVNSSSLDRHFYARDIQSEERFKSFKFVNPLVYFEQKLGSQAGELNRNVVEKGVTQPIIEDCVNARSVEVAFGQVVEAEIKSSELAKVHVEYPNYFFRPSERDLSYDGGRITRRIDSNWVQLVSPNNDLIRDSCLSIRYLNEHRFGVQTVDGWRLIDRNGKLMCDSLFRTVNSFDNRQATFELTNGSSFTLNSEGKIVIVEKIPEAPILLGKNYFYLKENSMEIFEKSTGRSDLVQAEEKFLEGYFIKKVDQKTRIRRFGSLESIEMELPSALKSFGKRVYCVDKETVVSIDSTLTIKKFKKIKSFRTVSPEIGWLEGKRDVLIDQKWNVLHTLTKNERFELRNGDLVILEGDSVNVNFGSLKPPALSLETVDIEPAPKPEPVVEVTYRDGKFGAVRGTETILPFQFTSLSKLSEEEFTASLGFEKQIFNSDLQRIGDVPYDYFFQTVYGYYVFYSKNGEWSAFTPMLDKIR